MNGTYTVNSDGSVTIVTANATLNFSSQSAAAAFGYMITDGQATGSTSAAAISPGTDPAQFSTGVDGKILLQDTGLQATFADAAAAAAYGYATQGPAGSIVRSAITNPAGSTSGTSSSGSSSSGSSSGTSGNGSTGTGVSGASTTFTEPRLSGTGPLLNQRLEQLAQCIAEDINALVAAENTAHGVLQSNIDTVEANVKAVDAEVKALIDDSKTSGASNTWSIDEINKVIAQQIATALNGLTPATIAMLEQLAATVAGDESTLTALLNIVNNSVRFDIVQNLSDAQKKQARDNIGAIGASDVADDIAAALTAHPIFEDADLCQIYVSARAGS